MRRDGYAARITALRRSEYFSKAEVQARYAFVAVGVVVILLVADLTWWLPWLLAYVVTECGYALMLHGEHPRDPRQRYWIGMAFYLAAALFFAMLPLALIASDVPGLPIMGAMGIVGLALYTLHRNEEDPGLTACDVITAVVLCAAVLAIVLPGLEGPGISLAVAATIVATFGYYITTVVTRHKDQTMVRDIERRYTESQRQRAMIQFVGGVAHDFNNQMTAIMGNLEVLDLLEDQHERARAIDDTRMAAGRASLTVKQLLASTGRARLTPEAHRAGPYLETRVPLLQSLVDPGVRIVLAPVYPALHFVVDSDMLETSLIQLCLNAQHAMKSRGTIRLSARAETRDIGQDTGTKACIALSVADDGPGVAPDALDKLTEPFYTTKAVGEGPGLGLSAVQGFARQSGGCLRIAHADLGGLEVTLLLPAG